MRRPFLAIFIASLIAGVKAFAAEPQPKIDREGLVSRNNPRLTAFDPLASLTVGNGGFAFTVDVTGLQTFPERCSAGIPLGTQSRWGWHSFANPEGYKPEDAWREFDFGRGHKEIYACQSRQAGRQRDAAEWLRANPHRLHLGCVGLALGNDVKPEELSGVSQTLDMWQGLITSRFSLDGCRYSVKTVCHPRRDMVAAAIEADKPAAISLRFPYPTGRHTDDACDWTANDRHSAELVALDGNRALLRRTLDETVYYVLINWTGDARLSEQSPNHWMLVPRGGSLMIACEFLPAEPSGLSLPAFADVAAASAARWRSFWQEGAAVDFSLCTDPRAAELERRVVLSQYLLAVQCAADTPPQETGLTYNSWFGKFHLEMIWWHQAWQALWGHDRMLERTLGWYASAAPAARGIARRQGFDGLRWMKMTDPWAGEAPSNVGSFLIWQQPHIIYLAELLYRSNPSPALLSRFGGLIEETAEFMASFATYDAANDRFTLRGCIPAQETLRAGTTVNPPFELSYWHYAIGVAQAWRERAGKERRADRDTLTAKLSPLAGNADGLYLASEDATDTYSDPRFTSDHMAVLGAVGILPMSRLVRADYMANTLAWVWDNWNWDRTWGWDYPMTAMNAARMGQPDKAVGALLMPKRTNTYLKNGHNYQDDRLRCYLPGNGGLLTAVALMCAGWDGCGERNPGFPKDGRWNVLWEGLKPMP